MLAQRPLWVESDSRIPRVEAQDVITRCHYLRSFPSGWTYNYRFGDAVIVFSIPANPNLETFLFSKPVGLRELARLWAPDGHAPDLMTRAIAAACRALRRDTGCRAVVSFADPNRGHHGGVYQAASWTYLGQSDETRVYLTPDGRSVARRAFHSGATSRAPHLPETRMLGKHRYVRCLDRVSRKALAQPAVDYPKPRLCPSMSAALGFTGLG